MVKLSHCSVFLTVCVCYHMLHCTKGLFSTTIVDNHWAIFSSKMSTVLFNKCRYRLSCNTPEYHTVVKLVCISISCMFI